MENRAKSSLINIERVINSELLLKEQHDTLTSFDRYNELEAKCSLNPRVSYLITLYNLGVKVSKPYERMTKEDLRNISLKQVNVLKERSVFTRLTLSVSSSLLNGLE